MFTKELDTFVKKFHQLWNDGVTAHLYLDTRGGDAWVGLRVHLGQVPGPPHRHFYQEDPRKESPSRQRRRARRAAARQSNIENVAEMQANVVEQATDTDISENVAEEVAKEVAEEASNDHQVDDELCSNVEYNQNILSDENSVTYRIIVRDSKDQEIEDFRNEVRQSFLARKVEVSHQLFEIWDYVKKNDHYKFYIKVKNDDKAREAIEKLKSEETLIRTVPAPMLK